MGQAGYGIGALYSQLGETVRLGINLVNAALTGGASLLSGMYMMGQGGYGQGDAYGRGGHQCGCGCGLLVLPAIVRLPVVLRSVLHAGRTRLLLISARAERASRPRGIGRAIGPCRAALVHK